VADQVSEASGDGGGDPSGTFDFSLPTPIFMTPRSGSPKPMPWNSESVIIFAQHLPAASDPTSSVVALWDPQFPPRPASIDDDSIPDDD